MTSLSRRWIAIGALIGALGVTLGAFGAHGLADYLSDQGYTGDDLKRRLDIFDTAILYQLIHALALVFTGLALEHRASAWWRGASWAFLFGVILFSGSLKTLTFVGSSWNWLGMIAPVGGISMIAGWVALAVGALRKTPSHLRAGG
jgi:uncharacterized membrane protein YgdD (TMEM256/DUF423 family)